MKKTYGYCRVSTKSQKIQRQIDNIKNAYPDAVIITEDGISGTILDRPAWARLCDKLRPGDLVVFDEVSRMSRNADDGFSLYQELYNKGIDLVFLKEPHINTEVYRKALTDQITMTDTDIDIILAAINKYLMKLAERQIEIAFQAAQTEVDHLRQRTSEGVRKAQVMGKQVGRATGSKVETQKSKEAKEIIKKHNKDFGGSLNNEETWRLAGISKMSFYKYKRELLMDNQKKKDYIFFWGIRGDYGFMSNFYESPFTIDGVTFRWSEQYFMAQKALTFNDPDIYKKIMGADTPQECKRLGRKVSGFDSTVWDSVDTKIMYEGLYAKFDQNPGLRKKLLSTGNCILVEASPKDKKWGIGLSEDKAKSTDPNEWPGKNLLGESLMSVRKALSKQHSNN